MTKESICLGYYNYFISNQSSRSVRPNVIDPADGVDFSYERKRCDTKTAFLIVVYEKPTYISLYVMP